MVPENSNAVQSGWLLHMLQHVCLSAMLYQWLPKTSWLVSSKPALPAHGG